MNALQPAGVGHMATISRGLATAATPRLALGMGLLGWSAMAWAYVALLVSSGGFAMVAHPYLLVHAAFALVLTALGSQFLRVGWAFWHKRTLLGSKREAGLWTFAAIGIAASMLLFVI